MRRFLIALWALAFASSVQAQAVLFTPAYNASIGTPVLQGTQLTASTTNNQITFANTVTSGSLVLGVGGSATSTVASLVGSGASCQPGGAAVWTLGTSVAPPSGAALRPYWQINSLSCNPGDTAGFAQGAASYSGNILASVGGIPSLDVQGAGSSSTGTGPSISTGTLAKSDEIVFGVLYVTNGNSDSFTEDSNFTSLGSSKIGSGTSDIIRLAYRVVTSTASVTYHPTLGTSRGYVVNVLSFKGL